MSPCILNTLSPQDQKLYNNSMDHSLEIGTYILDALYLLALAFNLKKLSFTYRKWKELKEVNLWFVLRTYLSITFTLLSRLICNLSFILMNRHMEYKNHNGLNLISSTSLGVLHKIFNILPLPMLLLTISLSTYQWQQIIIKAEQFNNTFFSKNSIEFQVQEKKITKTRYINYTVVTMYFILLLAYIPLPKNIVYHYINSVIFTLFMMQALLVRYYGLKIYIISGQHPRLGTLLTILQALLFLRAVHVMIQEIVYLSLDSQCLLEDVLLFPDGSFYGQGQQVLLVVYFVGYYVFFELLPCLILQFIIKPQLKSVDSRNDIKYAIESQEELLVKSSYRSQDI